MSKRLKIGMRVYMKATIFDKSKNVADRWSYAVFGEHCKTAKIYGTITEKSGKYM